MNIVLWVLQIVLGLMFLFAGGQKAFRPLDALATMMGWVRAVPCHSCVSSGSPSCWPASA
jgi:hypothetical protein